MASLELEADLNWWEVAAICALTTFVVCKASREPEEADLRDDQKDKLYLKKKPHPQDCSKEANSQNQNENASKRADVVLIDANTGHDGPNSKNVRFSPSVSGVPVRASCVKFPQNKPAECKDGKFIELGAKEGVLVDKDKSSIVQNDNKLFLSHDDSMEGEVSVSSGDSQTHKQNDSDKVENKLGVQKPNNSIDYDWSMNTKNSNKSAENQSSVVNTPEPNHVSQSSENIFKDTEKASAAKVNGKTNENEVDKSEHQNLTSSQTVKESEQVSEKPKKGENLNLNGAVPQVENNITKIPQQLASEPLSDHQTNIENKLSKTADDKKEKPKIPEAPKEAVKEESSQPCNENSDVLPSIDAEKISQTCYNKPNEAKNVTKNEVKVVYETKLTKPQTNKELQPEAPTKQPLATKNIAKKHDTSIELNEPTKKVSKKGQKKLNRINDKYVKLSNYFSCCKTRFNAIRKDLMNIKNLNFKKFSKWYAIASKDSIKTFVCSKNNRSFVDCYNCDEKCKDIDFVTSFKEDIQSSDLLKSFQKTIGGCSNYESLRNELQSCIENIAIACENLSIAFKNYAEAANISFRNSEKSFRWTTLRNDIGSDLARAWKKFNGPNVKKFFKTEQFNVKDVPEKMNAEFLEEFSVDKIKIELDPLLLKDV